MRVECQDALKKLEDYLSAISFHVDPSVNTRLAAFVGENVSIGGLALKRELSFSGLRSLAAIARSGMVPTSAQRDRGG